MHSINVEFVFKTDDAWIHSGDHPDACPPKVLTTGPLMQPEDHEDLVAPSSVLGASSEKGEQNNGKVPLNGMDDSGVQLQGQLLVASNAIFL